MNHSTRKGTRIKALVRGVWRPVGVLICGNRRPVFKQRIRPQDVLKIRGCAGVDVKYDPPLPENCIVRHVVGSATYEIPLTMLLSHPKATRERVGSLHPERVYLSYRYWRNVKQQQLELFAAGGEG
ncbi:MAG: hypothetical protein AB1374_02940 [Bacillota bacterium]